MYFRAAKIVNRFQNMVMRLHIFLFILLTWLCACSAPTERKADNGAFAPEKSTSADGDAFDKILESSELIITTLSGPDTYFDYNGRPMGRQYALAEDFAAEHGLSVRVELAHDTTELIKQLKNGDADIIALQLPTHFIEENNLTPAGATIDSLKTSWAVCDNKALAEALDSWHSTYTESRIENTHRTALPQQRVRRKVQAPYISREKGIISTYDHLFKQAAQTTGWDWRLLAAQCYQESGFDPNAISWAGARGLMQIMPGTAEHLGLPADRIFSPSDNVAAAAKLIKELSGKFSDIRNRSEKQRFVLAAYNGGYGHIRDAMTLTRKHGGNPERWADVSVYVRNLSLPQYYRDPSVKYGYMIGNETANYVERIMDLWRGYGGNPDMPGAYIPNSSERSGSPAKPNRFTKGTKIYGPDDPEFNQLED